ncbi:unnamed protein product [Orchesella dallaii]|uniref:Uncharacterized protein n=1 Tax=Orchesella dallaii TaxID=48710 RepID=A0ABP1QC41_9HEXA
MNTSKGGARCVTANSENISQIPEMGTLTVKEREYLAFESTAFSFISLLLTAPQVFSAVLLIKATDNGVKGAEVFGLIDHHAQIQLRYTIFQVLLVGASYYLNGFCSIFYLATGDGAFNSVLLLILSMFLCDFYLEECRNNEGDLEAQRKSSEKEKKVDENKKDMQK